MNMCASLRDRAGGLCPQPLRVFAVPALIACAALGGCDDDPNLRTIQCVNIASHERLIEVNRRNPDDTEFGFYGTDAQGFRRLVARDDAKWWKCRFVEGADQ
jgi:hypothetical protein